MHTGKPVHIDTCIHTYIYSYVNIYIYIYVQTYLHANTHTCRHKHQYMRHSKVNQNKHIYTEIYTHTHTCTHTEQSAHLNMCWLPVAELPTIFVHRSPATFPGHQLSPMRDYTFRSLSCWVPLGCVLGGPQDFLTRHSDLEVVGWCLAHNSATDYTNTPAIARSLCAGAVLAGCSDPHGLWLQIDDKGMRPRVDWVVRCISRCTPNRFVTLWTYLYIYIHFFFFHIFKNGFL